MKIVDLIWLFKFGFEFEILFESFGDTH